MATDITGRQIMPGQRVAYPVRKGSQMWLCTARVESINEGAGGITVHARNPEGRTVRITSLDRTVILPENTPR